MLYVFNRKVAVIIQLAERKYFISKECCLNTDGNYINRDEYNKDVELTCI